MVMQKRPYLFILLLLMQKYTLSGNKPSIRRKFSKNKSFFTEKGIAHELCEIPLFN